MKKLFSCLIALLCITGLTLPAMADVLPPFYVTGSFLAILLLIVVAIVVAIIVAIVGKHKK